MDIGLDSLKTTSKKVAHNGDVLAAATNENNKAEKNVAFKNNAPYRSCISKINSTLIDNAEDLDIVMSMYNLLEYSQIYSMTSGSS